jgi:hypothetical protein
MFRSPKRRVRHYPKAAQLMERKKRFYSLALFWPLFCLLLLIPSTIKGAVSESECVRCHINLKKLMELSWEVKKLKPKKAVSSKTSGEG